MDLAFCKAASVLRGVGGCLPATHLGHTEVPAHQRSQETLDPSLGGSPHTPTDPLPLTQECPSGVVNEETFKQIYAQFFPHGGESNLEKDPVQLPLC